MTTPTVELPGAAGPRSGWDRLFELPHACLLLPPIAAFLLMSVLALREESATFDEPIHLASGCTGAALRDYRLCCDNPPLAKAFAAIPLLLGDVRIPDDSALWRDGAKWGFSFTFLYQAGNDAGRMLLQARLMNLFWALLLLASVYAMAFDLFGKRAAWAALMLCSFSPTLLAHAHLVTVDVPGAALSFLAFSAFWLWIRQPGIIPACRCGLLLGGAIVTKFTALVLVPVFVVTIAVVLLRRSPTRRPCLRWALETCAILIAAGVVLWAAYGFRYVGVPDPAFSYPWAEHLKTRGAFTSAVSFLRDHRLLPEAFLFGLAELRTYTSAGHASYALGRYSPTGWWWYFPFAFLVKNPLPFLLFLGWGLVLLCRRSVTLANARTFVLVPLVVFAVVLANARVNIGIRHLLPLYPFAALAAAVPWTLDVPRFQRWQKAVIEGLLLSTTVGCLLAAPYFLSYFNLPSLLLLHRHEMLVDSNLDWGQDLARLKSYMERHGIREVKLAYFGSASPRHLDLRNQVIPGLNWYRYHEPEWPAAMTFLPGDYVAISATRLMGVYEDPSDGLRRRFEGIAPVATIGHSIFLFRIPPGGGRERTDR